MTVDLNQLWDAVREADRQEAERIDKIKSDSVAMRAFNAAEQKYAAHYEAIATVKRLSEQLLKG